MDPVTAVGLAASIVQLIDATTTAIKYLNDVKDAPKDRATLAREGSSLLALFIDLRYRVEEAESTDPWFTSMRSLGVHGGPLDQFKDAMEELARKLKPEAGIKKFGKALTWTLDKNEISNILSKIERLKTLVSLALQKDHFKLSQAIKHDTAKVKDVIIDRENQNIINWISPLKFPTKQNDFFGRRQAGTGEWLLEDSTFESWLDGTERTLWCPGLPGAGKTILTSIVVNHLEQHFRQDNVAIAYIYCSYKEQEDQTVVNLIGSLLQQLVQRNPVISVDIASLYHHHTKKQTRPTLDEMSKLLQLEICRLSKVFIAIDALDECPESNRIRESFLAEIRKLQPTIHLLITSRHISTIEREFEKAARVEIRATDEDVRRYLEGRIESEGRLVRLVKTDPALQATIVNTLVGNAKGMFLLAQLHMDSLAKRHSRRDVRKALENLPKELDDTYDEAIQRIWSQDEEDAKLAEQVLSWISYAFTPLTVIEVQHALAAESGDEDFDEDALPDEDVLVSVCAGLVTVDQESKIIRLVHYTTQEYFERIRVTRFPGAQTRIATACLVYISFDVFAEGYCHDDEKMETRMHKYPFLQYAAKHWGDHARGDQETIKERAIKFLEHKSKVLCSSQAMQLPEHRYTGFSQRFRKHITGLHLVAGIGLAKIVQLLLEREGVDADSKDDYGQTPLSRAAENGCEAVVRLLLERKGVDADSKDEYGHAPLSRAAANGREAVVRLLLERKDVDADSKNKDSRTPLWWAAHNGRETVVRLLLERESIDADSKDKYNETPLWAAALNGHEAVVRLLLERNGVDANSKDKSGRSPLWWAAGNGREAVVRLLLERESVDADSKDKYGRTPRWVAAANGREAVVRLLTPITSNSSAHPQPPNPPS